MVYSIDNNDKSPVHLMAHCNCEAQNIFYYSTLSIDPFQDSNKPTQLQGLKRIHVSSYNQDQRQLLSKTEVYFFQLIPMCMQPQVLLTIPVSSCIYTWGLIVPVAATQNHKLLSRSCARHLHATHCNLSSHTEKSFS